MRLRMVGVGVMVAAVAAAGASGGIRGGTITTFAGTGQLGFAGDRGPATSASLWLPRGVAADGKGNVYIADTGNERVRKVSSAGTITTLAGTGRPGFSGDGGLASAARLRFPVAVAADGQGNVYIADLLNSRVRKVSGGTITTFAGTGQVGSAGDGGPANRAQLAGPVGLAVDRQGNVYIFDTNSDIGVSRVRKVSSAGTITTFAGTGEPGFAGDGGPATSARLSTLGGLAADAMGVVYIADYGNQRVRKVDGDGTITTIAGNGNYGFSGDGGPATAARLYNPYGVAVDVQGNVYIADFLNSRIRKVNRAGIITTFAGTGREGFSGDGGPARAARLKRPHGVAVDGQGNVYIADINNNRVRKIWSAVPTAPIPAGGCSRSTARLLVERLRLGNAGFTLRPVAQVLCGAFTGRGSQAMAVSLTIPSCGRTGGWVVFRRTGGAWQLLLERSNGADLTAVGSDIRETQFVLRPTDAHCFPTGGKRARTWHWNGRRFTVSRWKYTR